MRAPRPVAPAPRTPHRALAGRGRLVLVALAVLGVVSGCSALGSSGTVPSELLGDRLWPIVEQVVGVDSPPAGGIASAPVVEPVEAVVRTIRLKPRPRPGPFFMDLYGKGDFLGQQTTYWCIPSATQTMMNIIDPGPADRSATLQRRLYRLGDRLDEDGTRSSDWRPDDWRGMSISEWAGLLNHFGYGPYEVLGAGTRQNALRRAARAMRLTGRPVGLVIWRGAHAWVMSGFTATADPAFSDDFAVTSVRVQDPWYPRLSSTWGRARPPNANVSSDALGEDFLPFDRPGRRHPDYDGRYMLVLPRLEPGTRVE